MYVLVDDAQLAALTEAAEAIATQIATVSSLVQTLRDQQQVGSTATLQPALDQLHGSLAALEAINAPVLTTSDQPGA